MTPGILTWIKQTRHYHPFAAGRVLEIGAFDVNGNPRSLFPDATAYIGVDQAKGPNVDLVIPAARLGDYFPPASFDCIVCCEMLEHDPTPWRTIDCMHILLAPGGWLFVTSPANGFREHRFPKDYWRLMPDAFREIVFAGMELRAMCRTSENINCFAGIKPFLARETPCA